MVPVVGQQVLLTPLCSERVHVEVLVRVDKVAAPTSSLPGYVYLDVREVRGEGFGPLLRRLLINVGGIVLYPVNNAVNNPATSGNTPAAT